MFQHTAISLGLAVFAASGCSDANFKRAETPKKQASATPSSPVPGSSFDSSAKPSETPAVEAGAVTTIGGAVAPKAGDIAGSSGQLVAGTDVVRFGINFEDSAGAGDMDFNDTVLCMNGRFVVTDQKRAQSTMENQAVIIAITNRSACTHTLSIRIQDTAGKELRRHTLVDKINGDITATIELDRGEFLYTVIDHISCASSSYPTGIEQAGPWSQVLLNQCNTTGN